MSNRLAGKVAIVTGAARGIGQAEALALASEGASIVVNDLGSTDETIEAIRAIGGKAIPSNHDAASWAGGEAIIATAINAFGRIDILINNAGIVRPIRIDQMSEAQWDAVIDASLKGYAATIRHAAPYFIAQRSGVIVNTGSTSGLGHYGQANYAAAKEGALGLTRTVARDLGEFGVRCNLIRPVNFMTTMATPEVIATGENSARRGFPLNGIRHFSVNAMPMPEHVAALALLLCLPATAHISGQDFFIQGDVLGRFPEPELIRTQFQPGGWTTAAMEESHALDNLIGSFGQNYVTEG